MLKTRLVEFMVSGCLAIALGLPAISNAAPPTSLNGPLLVQNQTNEQSKQSQNKIDKLASQTQDALQDYLTTMQQIDRLKAYNAQISKLIQSQEQQMAQMKQSMEQLGSEAKEITPLMLHMIDALGQFVKLDLPFNKQQRLQKVQDLRDMMDSADVTIAEKFRQIMTAYQDEINYGRTIEAYRGELNTNGHNRTVNFVRIGRLALVYQTLDQTETGYWNKNKNTWTVNNDLAAQVTTALNVARKQGQPSLITVPVPAPVSAAAESQS